LRLTTLWPLSGALRVSFVFGCVDFMVEVGRLVTVGVSSKGYAWARGSEEGANENGEQDTSSR
jgi:hypothetical protein